MLGLVAPGVAGGLIACSGDVVVDGEGGGGAGGNGGGNGGGGNGSVGGTKQCIDPISGTGGASSDPDPIECPTLDEAAMYVSVPECGWVESGPTIEDGTCCYVITGDECGPAGRPYLVDGRARTAAVQVVPSMNDAAPALPGGATAASGWNEAGALRPDVAALSTSGRALLAEAWGRDGLLEHASVASFGRFALELLAAGAPAALVADAHRAALDEVRHARLCFGLASVYAGESLAPGPFDFGRGVAVHADLPRLAARTFAEGCVGETLAAVVAAEQHAAAEDPAVRQVLAIIAEDEARHAELAWRAVAWALEVGGAPVRDALRIAMAQITATVAETPADATLRAHGRLDTATARAATQRTLREVVLPCARALLREGKGAARRTDRAAPPAGDVTLAAA